MHPLHYPRTLAWGVGVEPPSRRNLDGVRSAGWPRAVYTSHLHQNSSTDARKTLGLKFDLDPARIPRWAPQPRKCRRSPQPNIHPPSKVQPDRTPRELPAKATLESSHIPCLFIVGFRIHEKYPRNYNKCFPSLDHAKPSHTPAAYHPHQAEPACRRQI